jgi:hypothetical protein
MSFVFGLIPADGFIFFEICYVSSPQDELPKFLVQPWIRKACSCEKEVHGLLKFGRTSDGGIFIASCSSAHYPFLDRF